MQDRTRTGEEQRDEKDGELSGDMGGRDRGVPGTPVRIRASLGDCKSWRLVGGNEMQSPSLPFINSATD